MTAYVFNGLSLLAILAAAAAIYLAAQLIAWHRRVDRRRLERRVHSNFTRYFNDLG